ncbi:AhpC/TSA family protein [Cellulophaga sp. 20_2_10]|uniref:TlpA disulfide reductase family protein n=1 Tax=Cellulophaga sp. 20_2_10 TaxID=2942476 RepID=UPI00201A5F66|nr:TlpA disulfide reductase family protein [Cellulophaga sp. 20_2_10]MCL5246143.1 AhpC/TSA family protein [Cellulophaga sp. 20_2_10]
MRNIIKNLIAAVILILGITSCKNKFKEEKSFDGYVITGTINGVETGKALITLSDFGNRSPDRKVTVIDSAEIKNGKFQFKGNVAFIDNVNLVINNKFRSSFFLENSNINIALDTIKAERGGVIEAVVKGSQHQNIYENQRVKEDSVRNQPKFGPVLNLRAEMDAAYDSKDEKEIIAYREKVSGLMDLITEQGKEVTEFKYNYAKNNPSSPVATYILGFSYGEGKMSNEELETYYKVFKGEAQKTAMYAYFEKTYNEVLKSLAPGAMAPDFTLNNLEDKPVTLSKVNAKYKLVDFWASWCVPCRASFPHLKELRKKYNKNGFEIIGIGTADQEGKWRTAIEEDQTPWIHVFDAVDAPTGKGKGAYGKVSVTYGVPFLPTTFLIDENNKIILRNPSKEELDAKLKELMGY